jgi:hypothetical protein
MMMLMILLEVIARMIKSEGIRLKSVPLVISLRPAHRRRIIQPVALIEIYVVVVLHLHATTTSSIALMLLMRGHQG